MLFQQVVLPGWLDMSFFFKPFPYHFHIDWIWIISFLISS